ncbi:MAG: glycoside hydrolase domain-containing protein, partial [Eubacterium sp.]
MAKTKKHFTGFIAFLLCLIIIFLDTANMPVLATSAEEISPITNEQIAEALSNAQIVFDEESDGSDETSEANQDELGNIQSDYDYCSELYAQAVANDPMPLGVDLPGDDMVYLTQKWLNQEYGDVSGFGSVTENGKTGWDTIYGLTRALQYELGITNLANNFGSQTQAAYKNNILKRQDGKTDNMFAILQGALWCKGYSPGYNFDYNPITGTVTVDAVFDADVEEAIIEMKTDAGLINPDGVVTVNTMKALLSMDAFKLLKSYGGKEVIRKMQQKFNRKYEEYIGLMPCDGVYGRSTNKAVIYVLQAVEGMPVSVATGNFGTTTKLCCPTIPYKRNTSAARSYPGTSEGSYYTDSQISDFIELLQFGMYVNGVGDGTVNGVFDIKTQQDVTEFQKKFALPVTGKVDLTTWLSLFVSYGDKNRTALACDCATKLTAAKAKTLYDNGYRYVGRYLTKVPGGLDKDITLEEAQIILNAGLNFFPIYQTVGTKKEYFAAEQGASDANAAIEAARKLGVPNGTIIYFAVDFDALDVDITNNVIPYFAKVHETMEKSIYKTGVYGVRNVCTRVSDKGYAESSFVSNLSSGFSGNLGFPMPSNWAFDQFATVTIGEGSGSISIDKDGFSGKDTGVSYLDETVTLEIPVREISAGNSGSDTITGPTVDILGQKVPLFNLDIGFDLPTREDFLVLESEFNSKKNEVEVIIGVDLLSYSEKRYGKREKPTGEKFTQAVREVETMVTSIRQKNNKVFKSKYNDFKGSLYDRGLKIGFDCDTYFIGYMRFSNNRGNLELTSGEIGVIVRTNVSWDYPLVPTVCARFELDGDFQSGFRLIIREEDKVVFFGDAGFSLKPSIGVGVNAYIASAYAGLGGKIDCTLNLPVDNLRNSFEANLSASFYFEYNALKWGNRDEWTFGHLQIYPPLEEPQILSVSEDKMKLIQPLPQISHLNNNNLNEFKANMQVYTKPQIVYLNDGKMFMAYIDDSPNRTAENSTVLMYSVFDGSDWSTPQAILDDGTVDFEPSICADGNGG